MYIQLNFVRKLAIKEVAEHVHMSLKHFGRVFKKQVGLRPKAYLRLIRVEKAKKLLTDSDMKVTGIALDVGYADLRHFERDFKKVVGLLPMEYRSGKTRSNA